MAGKSDRERWLVNFRDCCSRSESVGCWCGCAAAIVAYILHLVLRLSLLFYWSSLTSPVIPARGLALYPLLDDLQRIDSNLPSCKVDDWGGIGWLLFDLNTALVPRFPPTQISHAKVIACPPFSTPTDVVTHFTSSSPLGAH